MKFCIIQFLLIIFIQMTFCGCIEEIPFKTNTGDGLLVVDGGFSDNDEPQNIRLQRTTAYGTAPTPVKGARVLVKSSDGKIGNYIEEKNGNYILDPQTLRGTSGQLYYLDITLSSGETYQSEPEIMPKKVVPDSIFWDFGTEFNPIKNTFAIEQKGVNIYVTTPFGINNEDTYLRWDLYSAFQWETWEECAAPISKSVISCYYSDLMTPQTLKTVSSKESKLNKITKARVGFQPIDPGYTFIQKHYFSLYQHAITAKAYDYWQKTNIVANQNGSIFDRVPASIQGNIFNKNNKKEQVLGYFQVSSVAIKRVLVSPWQVRKIYNLFAVQYYCNLLSSADGSFRSSGCCVCDALPYGNATFQRPLWW